MDDAQSRPRKKLPYDPNADLVAVSLIAQGPNVLVVNASSPYRTVADLLAAAKKSPQGLSFGTYGNGSSPHLQAPLLMQRTGAAFTHVPYKGSAPAINVAEAKRTAARRAHFHRSRHCQLQFFCLVRHPRTGQDATERDRAPAQGDRRIVRSPAIAKQFADQGLELTSSSPTDYACFLATEDKTRSAVIQQAGITID